MLGGLLSWTQSKHVSCPCSDGRSIEGWNEHCDPYTEPKDAGDEPALGMKGRICCDCGGPGSAGGVVTLMRFGKWDEILKMKVPAASAFDPVDKNWANQQRALWHYTRAAAYWAMSDGGAKLNMVKSGDAEALLSKSAAKDCADPGNFVNLTAIIPAELDGLRSYHVDRDWRKAIQSYHGAVAFDDSNPYMEPPAMYYPPAIVLALACFSTRRRWQCHRGIEIFVRSTARRECMVSSTEQQQLQRKWAK